jgi:anti-anti-sigma factor
VSHHDDVVWYLRIEREQAESVTLLTVSGRVSHRSGPALEDALNSAAASTARGVVLDLSGVDYVSSAGLRTIERTSDRLKQEGRAFVVCSLKDAVRLTFNLAGLDRLLTIEPSREAAIESCRSLPEA